MRRALVVVLIIAALTIIAFRFSRTKNFGQKLASASTLMDRSIRFRYTVYMLPRHVVDPALLLRKMLDNKYSDLRLVDAIPGNPAEMVVSAHLQNSAEQEYEPPNIEMLKSSGYDVSEQQRQALQKSQEAFFLEFAHPKTNVWTAMHNADALIEEIARNEQGLIWDEETRETFSPDAWHKKRLASWSDTVPDISSQTVIHIYKKDEFVRAITLGMKKAGLPDAVVDDFFWSSENQVGHLIELFCQSIAEGVLPDKSATFYLNVHAIKNAAVRDRQVKSLKKNSTGIGFLSLKEGVREEGDPDNRLIQITFDRYGGTDLHAKRERMLSCFFGWEDTVKAVRHDGELLEVSAKARSKLPELHKAFSSGLQPGEFIQIKVPFPTPEGGNEWMWVEVTSWKGSKIRGLLENEPLNVPDLHGGQIVEIREGDVFDYLLQHPDGSQEGNTTGAILKKMAEAQNAESGASIASRMQMASDPSYGCTPD
jgi:uncharacterized protein YegJ (DUF2314 family)